MAQEPSGPESWKTPPSPGGEWEGESPPQGEEKSTRRITPGKEIPPFSGLLEKNAFDEDQEEIRDEFHLPRSFGKYILLEKLGRGGMGVVFLAEDRVLKRKVALKILRRETLLFQAEARERFQREARAAARLDHPGICPVYEVGEYEGLPFMAMRYVRGRTLAREIARWKEEGRIPDKTGVMDLVKLAEKTARTLHAAHEAGLVHRDIKPANIMIDEGGNPVLLDFGLARETAPLAKELTLTLTVVGTPHYLPPERFEGRKGPPDLRGDVYSLGATLYEALTLECPFDGKTLEELTSRIKDGRYPDPRSLNPSIPRDLALVLGKAMDKNPARRYATALEFAEDLRRVRTYEPVQVRPAGPLLKTARWAQRNPILATSLAGIFLALLVGFLSTYFLLRKVRSAFLQARALGLLTASKEALPRSARLSLLLAMESYRLLPREGALSQVLQALAENPETASIPAPFPTQAGNGQIAVSPAGDRILLPSIQGTLDLWDTRGRKLLSIPADVIRRMGKTSGIQSLSFSPGGDSFLAAGWDGLCLWSLGGKRLLSLERSRGKIFPSHKNLRYAWFSRDGSKLVLFFKGKNSSSATLQVLGLGGEVLHRVTFPCPGLLTFGFQPSRGIFWFLAEENRAGAKKAISLQGLDLEGKAVPYSLSFPDPPAKAGFSPGGRFFAVRFSRETPGGRPRFWIRVYDLRGRVVLEDSFSQGGSNLFAFSRDEKWLAYTRGDWTVVVRSLAQEGHGKMWIAHNQAIRVLAFAPDDRHILSGSRGGKATLWNLQGKRILDFSGHEAGIRKGGFLGRRACFTLSEDGSLKIWRTRLKGTPLFEPGPATNEPFFIRSPGDTVFLIGPSGRIEKWSPEGRFLGSIPYPGKAPIFLYGDPETGAMVVSSRDGIPRFWDPVSKQWSPLPGLRGIVLTACFRPGGGKFGVSLAKVRGQTPGFFLFSHGEKTLAPLFHFGIWSNWTRYSPSAREILLAGGIKKGLYVLDEEGKTLLHAFAGRTCRMAVFLDSGRRIAAHVPKRGVFLLDRKGNILARFPNTNFVKSLDASPGGKAFLYASRDGILWVRDSAGSPILRYVECEGPLHVAEFSPSGGRILCATPKVLKILEASSGRILLRYHPGKNIWRAGFTPSGKRAWILFRDVQGLQILPLEAEAILELAAGLAGKGFTRREREAYRSLLEED